ncbi:oxygen-independent coproporphyrinogen III oxidase [Variovorax sp. HJSM1_2]|uniref:oxygen-independent coproporphyrinogen III oxidase n=1 Tax=Variovorax sp. HJSM1_2 TaxID=3366263 RepID=UPI003BE9D101
MSMITPEVLRRMDQPGPRYTSYPTADRFVDGFQPAGFIAALAQRREHANAGLVHPLSLYVHIPFCESLCYFCACNKIVTRQRDRAQEYLDYLTREVALQVAHLGPGQAVSQLHLGGGTPTFLSDEQLAQLMQLLRDNFRLAPDGEFSIEVDPRTVTPQRLANLAALGFNRLSFGVQDFDPAVQQAVHRVQAAEEVFALVAAARAQGFKSINIDLIYGLPRQTAASFARTLEQVRQLRPDRLALYAYAHLPERFKPQRRIAQSELPVLDDKLGLLRLALDSLVQAGYVHVGMDHLALPGDALAVAKRQGRLHRNFQGYSTQAHCDLLGLGVSAIGRMGALFTENARDWAHYRSCIDQGQLPIARGLLLSRDDLVRQSVIMAFMCQGEVQFESIATAHFIDFRRYFEPELAVLAEFERDGLLEMNLADQGAIRVTAIGWYLVRTIAMVFDRYLQLARGEGRERFSRVV